MNISELNVENDLFCSSIVDNIAVLSFKNQPLLTITDLRSKNLLFGYLEMVSSCDEIKVLIIRESPIKLKCEEYIEFYQKITGSDIEQTALYRLYNAMGQYLLQLMGMNKIIVHADSGTTIFLYMNIGLACDYRIVADNTIFQNPNMRMGLIPKGGSSYLLSKMLGRVAASKILFSPHDIDADEARRLGIVDQIVPLQELDARALETARFWAGMQSGYAVGVKKMLNFDIKEYADVLKYENVLLRQTIESGRWR